MRQPRPSRSNVLIARRTDHLSCCYPFRWSASIALKR